MTALTSLTSRGHCDALLHVGPTCLIVGVVFLCHTLPCAQQQPQHRERLETFDDVIRSSLEVTGRSGRRVYDERKCIWYRFGV